MRGHCFEVSWYGGSPRAEHIRAQFETLELARDYAKFVYGNYHCKFRPLIYEWDRTCNLVPEED